MTTPKRWPAILFSLTVLAALLSGCATSSAGKAAAIATTLTYPTHISTPAMRSFQQAWGNVKIIRLPTVLPNNQYFDFVQAASPDGQWLVGSVQSRNATPPYTSAIALYNIRSRQLKVIHSAPSGVAGAAFDGTWLAWSEQCFETTPCPWSLNLYNLQTGAFRQIVTGTMTRTDSGWTSTPIISNGRMVWSQVTGQSSANGPINTASSVRIMQLDTGAITTLASSTFAIASVSYSWPLVGWVTPIDNTHFGATQFKNLVTGQVYTDTFFPTAEYASPVLLLDGVTAALDYESQQIYIALDVTQNIPALELYSPQDGGAEFASLSHRLMAWQTASPMTDPMVYDRVQNALISLPVDTTPTSIAWTGANLLIWQDPPTTAQATADTQSNFLPSDTLCIVNTDTLPTKPV